MLSADFESGLAENMEGEGLRQPLPIPPSDYMKKYNAWKTAKLITGTSFKEVSDSHAKIFKYITAKKQGLSENAQKSNISALVDAMKRTNGLTDENAIKYSEFSSAIAVKKSEQSRNNVQTIPARIENPITFDRVVAVRNSLLEDFNNGSIDDNRHINLIILALNTYQPPLRNDIADMQVFDIDKVPKSSLKNYLIKRPNGSYAYRINRVRKDPTNKKKNGAEYLEIALNPKANEFMSRSLELMPRSFVLPKLRNLKEPLEDNSYKKRSEGMLGKTAGADTYRSAYVSEVFRKYGGKISGTIEEKIAKQMLTSVQQMRNEYFKINPDQSVENVDDLESPSAVPVIEAVADKPVRPRATRPPPPIPVSSLKNRPLPPIPVQPVPVIEVAPVRPPRKNRPIAVIEAVPVKRRPLKPSEPLPPIPTKKIEAVPVRPIPAPRKNRPVEAAPIEAVPVIEVAPAPVWPARPRNKITDERSAYLKERYERVKAEQTPEQKAQFLFNSRRTRHITNAKNEIRRTGQHSIKIATLEKYNITPRDLGIL